MILPGKFSQITNEVQESNVYDVRQNLKTFHREENTDEYCVVFRVEKAMKSCKLNEDTNTLIRGKYEKFYIIKCIIKCYFQFQAQIFVFPVRVNPPDLTLETDVLVME